nr:hypothetical protein [uncultured Mucilaginibacter sp.]
MKLTVFKIWILTVIIGFGFYKVDAQQLPVTKLKSYATALTNIRELKPVEKLYLQTDKPYYSVGDTLRFKGYLLNADYLTPSLRTGLLYVELDNEQGKSAKRIMVPVISGMAWGDMTLDSAEVPDGNYTLRAYTNWMRNFGEDYIFRKTITVSKSADNPLLVKANFKQVGNKVEGELLFSLLDGRIQAFRDVELKVMNGKRNLSKDKVITSADGSVKVNFTLPEGEKALSIQATTTGSGLLNIPVLINRKENTDVQFMPEGGQLVAGLPVKIGFKAVGEDGKSVFVSGKVVDNKGKQVAVFTSAHAGMGSFEFTPEAGEVYSAKVDGIVKTYALPDVKLSGTALAVKQTKDSVQVVVSATSDARGIYSLVAQANGIVCFAKTMDVDKSTKISVDKKLFPTGIARFTLFNNYQPLNERIVFIDNHDNLNINVNTNKATYTTRDSIALNITVKDKDGNPVQGNFSLAVTDNSQIKLDSLGNNILNNLLLTSDLKGDIEGPGYYFTPGKEDGIDNLLLTQGWVGYNWQEVFYPKLPYAYKPEKEFVVTGKVTTAFGSPIEKSNVVLVANHPLIFKDTLTDNTGRFIFKGLFPVDTAIFKLQARNKKGKEMNVKIEMEEFKPPAFNPNPLTNPWYLNTDSILINNSKARIAEERALSSYRGEGNVLKEANIKAKKIIPGSKNLNGAGEADLIIDEEELKKADKMTLEELLLKKVKGFTVWWPAKYQPKAYYINGKRLFLIIDGYNLNSFYTGKTERERYLYMKTYMDYFTAEDITGIELMFNVKYAVDYIVAYVASGEDIRAEPNPLLPYTYLEVTTRAKKGPFMQVTPGTYLYKTFPFSVAKQFYSPKYTLKNKSIAAGTDLRSTIFWDANVTTDKDGKAVVSFYSADKAANYTVLLEGTDMAGQLGYKKHIITVSH